VRVLGETNVKEEIWTCDMCGKVIDPKDLYRVIVEMGGGLYTAGLREYHDYYALDLHKECYDKWKEQTQKLLIAKWTKRPVPQNVL